MVSLKYICIEEKNKDYKNHELNNLRSEKQAKCLLNNHKNEKCLRKKALFLLNVCKYARFIVFLQISIKNTK